MFIIKNSLKNLISYRFRYIIFGVLLLAAAAVGISALGVYNASANIAKKLKNEYGAVLYVYNNGTPVTPELTQIIARSPSVKEYKIVRTMIPFYGDQISINGTLISDMEIAVDLFGEYRFEAANISMSLEAPELKIFGVDFDKDIYINNNNTEAITEGRLPQASDEVVVNKRVLTTLGLDAVKLGDKISLRVGTIKSDFTIVGFFDGAVFSFLDHMGDSSDVLCCLFTSPDGIAPFCDKKSLELEHKAKDYRLDPNAYIQYTTYFYLNSPEDYDSFVSWLVKYNSNHETKFYTRFVRSGTEFLDTFDDTQRIARFFITVILAVSGAVLTLMAVLSMHERRYEIGVYLSIGMGKFKIWLQFACELILYVMIVLIPGLAAGYFLTPAVYGALIRGSLKLEGAAVTPAAAGVILLAGAGLALAASVVCALSILAFPPMSILRDRN